MGLFGSKRRRAVKQAIKAVKEAQRAEAKATYVQVKFAALDSEPSPGASGYAYRWILRGRPRVGDRVMVPGLDGISPAVVVGFGRGGYRGEIVDVARLPSAREIAAAAREREKRRAAGLKKRRVEQRTSTGASSAPTVHRAVPGVGLVRGRHYTEWVDHIKELKRQGAHVEAVRLLRECQAATIQADRGRPAPWYFEQEAIICRKDKYLDAEHAVLQRYFNACIGAPHPNMAERWERVQELLAKRAGDWPTQ